MKEKNEKVEEKVAAYIQVYLDGKMLMLDLYMQLKRLVDILYDQQDLRKATASREQGLPKETAGVFSGQMKLVEKDLTERIRILLGGVPEYHNVFEGIKGIGPRLAGSWISNIMIKFIEIKPEDLEKYNEVQQRYKQKTKKGKYLVPTIRGITNFATVSDLWSWCGQLPRLRRVRAHGEVEGGWVYMDKDGNERTVHINPKMQTLSWKTSGQFVRGRLGKGKVPRDTFYGKAYETYKSFLTNSSRYSVALQDPKFCPNYEACTIKMKGSAERLGREVKAYPCKKHIDNMARRSTVKDFIRDIFVAWRKSEGLPVPPAYDPNHVHHGE